MTTRARRESPTPASEPAEPVQPETEPAGEPTPEPVQPTPEPAVEQPEPVAWRDGVLVRWAGSENGQPLWVPLAPVASYSAPEALVEVLRRVQPIAKTREADQRAGGYKFRGIDDAYNALHDVLGDVGLVVLPKVLERLREQRPTSGGGTNHVTSLHVEFTFVAADGSRETCSTWGEGGDTGDKSTQKAHSQALKTALLEVFMIPTQQSAADDPDATNVEPGRAFTRAEVERAGKAYDAALDAATVEALAGVRHRALALLDVPVEVDGTLTPLSLLFDSRRNAIERGTPAEQQPA